MSAVMAGREELKLLINLVRPTVCGAYTGEYRHMMLYSKMAQELGYPMENVILPDVGNVMELQAAFGKSMERSARLRLRGRRYSW